jgi:hypothetical protein
MLRRIVSQKLTDDSKVLTASIIGAIYQVFITADNGWAINVFRDLKRPANLGCLHMVIQLKSFCLNFYLMT